MKKAASRSASAKTKVMAARSPYGKNKTLPRGGTSGAYVRSWERKEHGGGSVLRSGRSVGNSRPR